MSVKCTENDKNNPQKSRFEYRYVLVLNPRPVLGLSSLFIKVKKKGKRRKTGFTFSLFLLWQLDDKNQKVFVV